MALSEPLCTFAAKPDCIAEKHLKDKCNEQRKEIFQLNNDDTTRTMLTFCYGRPRVRAQETWLKKLGTCVFACVFELIVCFSCVIKTITTVLLK